MNALTSLDTTRVPALLAGASVGAIIPRSIEEIWRVSTMVVRAGLAPAALINNKNGDDAVSAVAVAIMSGAELGMKPMSALRSFTVINGRPALYGDGLINVIRASGRASYLRSGAELRDGKLVGWCEAKRSDTGEEKRVEFSQDDAIRAKLWETDARVTKQGKNGPYTKDNDSPWFKYPQRMLAWRAAGYCLRELFADVLGGITDEYEAREIAGEIYEPEQVAVPVPPSPPSPPSALRSIDPNPDNSFDEVTDVETEQQSMDLLPPSPSRPTAQTGSDNPADIIADAETRFACVQDEGDWEELRSEFAHLQETLFPPDWSKLVDIMQQAYDRVAA